MRNVRGHGYRDAQAQNRVHKRQRPDRPVCPEQHCEYRRHAERGQGKRQVRQMRCRKDQCHDNHGEMRRDDLFESDEDKAQRHPFLKERPSRIHDRVCNRNAQSQRSTGKRRGQDQPRNGDCRRKQPHPSPGILEAQSLFPRTKTRANIQRCHQADRAHAEHELRRAVTPQRQFEKQPCAENFQQNIARSLRDLSGMCDSKNSVTIHCHIHPILMANAPAKIVIIGGGFGGLYAAKKLARHPVEITLVDRKNHHLFQPLLYQVATAGLSPAEIAAPIRQILEKFRNVRVLMGEVTGIDVAERRVHVDRLTLPYDYLIVAAGASHSYFGHDEWAKDAPGLKTIEDALEIRRRILLAFELAERQSVCRGHHTPLNFVVIGGGPTGVELAGTLAEITRHALAEDFRSIDPRRTRILLLEAGPRVLAAFPDDLSRSAQQQLEHLGVEVRTGAKVTNVGPNFVQTGDEVIHAAVVLWGAGVLANPLGRALGAPLDRSGRVTVEPDCSIPAHPEVFVIGDMARFEQDGNPLPGLAPVAIQQGDYVASAIAADLKNQPRKPFRYRDKGTLATIGRAAAVANFGRVHLSGFFAWLAWLFVHILFLIGFRNRLIVMINWAYSFLTKERTARLITGSTVLPSAEADTESPPPQYAEEPAGTTRSVA